MYQTTQSVYPVVQSVFGPGYIPERHTDQARPSSLPADREFSFAAILKPAALGARHSSIPVAFASRNPMCPFSLLIAVAVAVTGITAASLTPTLESPAFAQKVKSKKPRAARTYDATDRLLASAVFGEQPLAHPKSVVAAVAATFVLAQRSVGPARCCSGE